MPCAAPSRRGIRGTSRLSKLGVAMSLALDLKELRWPALTTAGSFLLFSWQVRELHLVDGLLTHADFQRWLSTCALARQCTRYYRAARVQSHFQGAAEHTRAAPQLSLFSLALLNFCECVVKAHSALTINDFDGSVTELRCRCSASSWSGSLLDPNPRGVHARVQER